MRKSSMTGVVCIAALAVLAVILRVTGLWPVARGIDRPLKVTNVKAASGRAYDVLPGGFVLQRTSLPGR